MYKLSILWKLGNIPRSNTCIAGFSYNIQYHIIVQESVYLEKPCSQYRGFFELNLKIKSIQIIFNFSIKEILDRVFCIHSFHLRSGKVRSAVLQSMGSELNDLVNRVSDGLRPIGISITHGVQVYSSKILRVESKTVV